MPRCQASLQSYTLINHSFALQNKYNVTLLIHSSKKKFINHFNESTFIIIFDVILMNEL